MLLRSLKNTVRPCSICSPPDAKGPVLMVRNPTRIGAACAGAAGTLSTCVAAPAASAPVRTSRRFMRMVFLPLDGAVDSSLTLCTRMLINPDSELTRRLRFFRRNDGQQQVGLFVAAEMQARDSAENAVRTIDWIVM